MEKLHVEHAVVKTDGGKKHACHLHRPVMHRARQTARIVEAHEGFGARIHHGLHDADLMQHRIDDVAVHVVLHAAHRLLQQQAVCRSSPWQALARDPLERLDQAANHPQFPGPKAGVGLQFFVAVDGRRQHRKSGLDGLDELRVMQAFGHRLAIRRVKRAKRQIGLRAHLLQHLARVQFVLARQHRLDRRTRPAHAFGQQRGGQRAELLMVREHRAPARRAGAALQARHETLNVESNQTRIAGKTEQVEPFAVQWKIGVRAAKAGSVPVVVEQYQRAARRISA